MGVVKKALDHYEEKLTGNNILGDINQVVMDTDPITHTVGVKAQSYMDEVVFGTTAEEMDKPIVLPEAQAEYSSRENPAIVRTESDIELLSEEELEEQALLGKTKKNRLSVPLTGEGLSSPTAGIGTGGTPTGPAPSSGLKI